MGAAWVDESSNSRSPSELERLTRSRFRSTAADVLLARHVRTDALRFKAVRLPLRSLMLPPLARFP
jgi:hypothetical protein